MASGSGQNVTKCFSAQQRVIGISSSASGELTWAGRRFARDISGIGQTGRRCSSPLTFPVLSVKLISERLDSRRGQKTALQSCGGAP